jgi:hypothetical protein
MAIFMSIITQQFINLGDAKTNCALESNSSKKTPVFQNIPFRNAENASQKSSHVNSSVCQKHERCQTQSPITSIYSQHFARMS